MFSLAAPLGLFWLIIFLLGGIIVANILLTSLSKQLLLKSHNLLKKLHFLFL